MHTALAQVSRLKKKKKKEKIFWEIGLFISCLIKYEASTITD